MTNDRRFRTMLRAGCVCVLAGAGCKQSQVILAPVEPVVVRAVEDSSFAVESPVVPTGSVTLESAVERTVRRNLKLKASAEKVEQARADFHTDSLKPNPSLFIDAQLLPLQGTDINNQAGPPQYDALVTLPIDWWLFGKRISAMEASRLGVEVADLDQQDRIRKAIGDTVLGYYDVLEAEALVKISAEDLTDLARIEAITKRQVDAGGAGAIELDRIRLATLDAKRELRRRGTAVTVAHAKLRPLIGVNVEESFPTIEGKLAAPAKPPEVPKLETVLAQADANRPDILSNRQSVAQGLAAINREERKAKPQVSITPGYTYQDQRAITGFRNASLFDIGLTTTLPFSDRNQGNIAKAVSQLREAQWTLQADRADIRTELEQAISEYAIAREAIVEDDPATLIAAKDFRDKTEAAYNAGGKRLLELIDAQRAYRDRYRASISSLADFWRAWSKIRTAIGAGPDVKNP